MYRKISTEGKKGRGNFWKAGLGIVLWACALLAGTGASLEAAPFPDHQVQWIIPFGPGSGADLCARAIQPYGEKNLGVPLIIANVPGADSRLGMTRLFKAKPDGYTLGIHGYPSPIIHEYLFDIPYKSLDFTLIYAWTMNPQMIYVAEESSIKSFDDLIAEARKRPVTMGLPGIGTVTHLLALALEKQLKVKFKFVTFPGSAQGFATLAGNHIDANVGSDAAALGLVRAKRVRPVLSWSFRPNANHPDVPVSAKINIPTIVMTRGVLGPPNMPAERVRVLEKAFAKAAAEPKLAEWAKDTGTDLVSLNAKQFRQEVEKQQSLVREYKDVLKVQ